MAKLNVGMDVGTTNSAIGVATSELNVTILNIPNSKNGILPSCVKYLTRDKVEVGVSAYESRYLDSVVYSMKRHMKEGEQFTVHIKAEDGSEFDVNPIEVTSKVIRAMLDGLEAEYGKDCYEKITITVPAYFNDIARFNTIKAGVMAGLKEENIYLINEPTAAAVSYGITKVSKAETVMVYDLGGGTFDITIMNIIEGANGRPTYDVLASGGNDKLGGDDIDNFLATIAVNKVKGELRYKFDPNGEYGLQLDNMTIPPVIYKKVVLFAEKVKRSCDTAGLPMEATEDWFTPADAMQLKGLGMTFPYQVVFKLDVTDVEDAVQEIFDRTTEAIELTKSRCPVNLSRVLLVGGSTKSAILREAIADYLPSTSVRPHQDPDRAVAEGAAINTLLHSTGEGDRLNDIIQIPIGIKITDRENINKSYVKVLIPQDQHLPAEGVEYCSTIVDNQDNILLEIYQGISRNPSSCAKIGDLKIDNIPKMPAGKMKFTIRLTVSINGILHAKVTQCDERGEGVRTYEKEIIRLASGGSKAAPSKNTDRFYQRRIEAIKSIVKNPEDQARAIADFDKIDQKDNIAIKEFLDGISKYNEGTGDLVGGREVKETHNFI